MHGSLNVFMALFVYAGRLIARRRSSTAANKHRQTHEKNHHTYFINTWLFICIHGSFRACRSPDRAQEELDWCKYELLYTGKEPLMVFDKFMALYMHAWLFSCMQVAWSRAGGARLPGGAESDHTRSAQWGGVRVFVFVFVFMCVCVHVCVYRSSSRQD